VTLRELAERLAMPQQTVYHWLRRGDLRARRASVGRRPIWLVTADADEIGRLRALRPTDPSGRSSGSRASTPSDS
jgi:predicted site-specific integrase-resolvase